jgi:hypothetical protein
MINFLKRCWQRRWIRGMAWTGVTLVTLCVLFYAYANWSGAREWSATQAMLKANGETLDFRAILNDPIPEEENFCAIPPLKNLAFPGDNDDESAQNRQRLEALKLPQLKSPRPKFGFANGELTDFKIWAEAFRNDGLLPASADSGNPANDVLQALSIHDALVVELTAGLSRPGAQWTPEWKSREWSGNLFSVEFPHLSSILTASRFLGLRSIAAARAGEAAQAHREALLIARFSQACLNDPFLIGTFVGALSAQILCDTTWELCDAHVGTVEDFARLETALTGLDFQRSTLRSFRAEMAAGGQTAEFMKRNRNAAFGLFALLNSASENSVNKFPGFFEKLLCYVMPSGWFDSSASVLVDSEFNYFVKPLRYHGFMAARESAKEANIQIGKMGENIWSHPSYIVPAIAIPALEGAISKMIYADVIRNQSVIACALERYRIEKGTYPDSLDAVKLANGKPLPLDIIRGKPMNYRKNSDGTYALWSVGLDSKDDGGKRGVMDSKDPSKSRPTDENYLGDWVWDLTAK